MTFFSRGEAVYDGENVVAVSLKEFTGRLIYWDRADFRFADGYSFDDPRHRAIVNKQLRERRDEMAKHDFSTDWVV